MTEKRGSVEQIQAEALRLGLDLVGVAPLRSLATARYCEWLAQGYHGEMAYLARPDAVAKRGDLTQTLPGARSVLAVAANYYTLPVPPQIRGDRSRGIMSSYAWGRDYHDVLLPRLQALAAAVETISGEAAAHRAYIDTGPVLERELAVRAGLGFVGKNTNLIHPRFGSWLFLGELLLVCELVPEHSHSRTNESASGPGPGPAGTCGRCTRCLDACPTGALVAPYVLDARRCISYLTIELKGPIPRRLRPLLGNHIFGCDICQEICPWNKRFARPCSEPAFQPREDAVAPRLLELMALDDEGFRQRFRDSPVARAKRRGLLRNAAVALGNWGDPIAIPALSRALRDSEPLVRGHAAWALGQIQDNASTAALLQAQPDEGHEWVQEELALALKRS